VSGRRKRSWAAVSAALLVFGAGGPAFAQSSAPAVSANGVLPGGVSYELRSDPAQRVAAVALWFRAPAGGFEPAAIPGLSRLAAATVAASTPVTGTSLAQLVDRWGGRITVAAYPDSVAVTALVPADRAAQAVRAMTADFFAPVIGASGLQLAQRDSAEVFLYRSLGPEAIEDALGAALFADGPLHDGTIGTVKGLSGVTLERVRTFAERAFRPANALLVLTGQVDAGVLRGVATRAGAAPGGAAEAAAAQTPRDAPGQLRNAANLAGIGLGWIGPPITAEADATALDFTADALFAPRTGLAAKALGTLKATVTGKFVTFRNPGVFLVTISGDDAEAARPIVERVLADAAKPMTAAAFEAAQARFIYRTLGDLTTPADAADTYGWYTIEGDPEYAPAEGGAQGRYFTLAAKLTPETVARTIATYLGRAPAVVTQVKRSGKAA
jgi:predicted Zn-dependent peptidase